MDGTLCILCKCCCSQFYSSDNCVTGNTNNNKCGQTSRSEVGFEIQTNCDFKACPNKAVCVWIPSIAYALILFWKYDAAKIFGYTLQSVCLLVSAVCYSKIFLTLRHHVAEVQEHVYRRQYDEGAPLDLKRYRKTVSTAVWVLISLVICYMPHIIVAALYTVNGPFHVLESFRD